MKFRNRISNFLSGRYGSDELNRFLSVAALVFLLASVFTTRVLRGYLSSFFEVIALLCILVSILRIFSRNPEKRRKENARYRSYTGAVKRRFLQQKTQFQQRKEYRFYKCPQCRAVMRVPRGKGKIRISCGRCGNEFTANS